MGMLVLAGLLASQMPSGWSITPPETQSYSGECLSLVTPASDFSAGCMTQLFQVKYADGRVQYSAFTKNGWGIGFIGKDPASSEQGDVIVDVIVRASRNPEEGAPQKAKGRCTQTGVSGGPVSISCNATTETGTYRFEFLTDGKPPIQLHRN